MFLFSYKQTISHILSDKTDCKAYFRIFRKKSKKRIYPRRAALDAPCMKKGGFMRSIQV